MLKDTDLFDKLPELITFGDVLGTIEWTENAGPESYTVNMTWRFRSKRVGRASTTFSKLPPTDDYQVLWNVLEFSEDHQGKGLYSLLLKTLSEELPEYGIVKFAAAPLDKTAEGIFKASGWEWTDLGLTADLTSTRVRQWRSYKFGKGRHPKWRRDVLDEHGLSDDVEAV